MIPKCIICVKECTVKKPIVAPIANLCGYRLPKDFHFESRRPFSYVYWDFKCPLVLKIDEYAELSPIKLRSLKKLEPVKRGRRHKEDSNFINGAHLSDRNERKPKYTKVYCLTFSCSVIRMIHLELANLRNVTELTNAFRKFISRRNIPDMFDSDMEKSFEKVASDTKELFADFMKSDSRVKLVNEYNVHFRTNVSYSPFLNGLIERIHCLVAKGLIKCHKFEISVSNFEMLLHQQEAIVNSRPLSDIKTPDRDELQATLLISYISL